MDQSHLQALNHELAGYAKQVRQAFDISDYQTARHILINQVLIRVPNHVVALTDLAFAERKLGHVEVAYDYLLVALRHSRLEERAMVCDELVGVCYELHKYEETRHYAGLALMHKKQEVVNLNPHRYVIPAQPAAGLSDDKTRNIISYSLYGAEPKYCETAVINVSLAALIYPEWTCRFYIDDSVPTHVVTRLQQRGAQVLQIDAEMMTVPGLFWRFLVTDDEDVDCYVVRDADSLLSYKERAAVDDWLASGKYFHVMRDGIQHCELILAGMWGGYTGIFSGMRALILAYAKQLTPMERTIDQRFLREVVWATVSGSVLVHDSERLDATALPFPKYRLSDVEKIPYFHVGMIDSGAQRVHISIEETTAKLVDWYLINDKGQLVCRYRAQLDDAKRTQQGLSLAVSLPYFYAQKIKTGQWQIRYQVVA